MKISALCTREVLRAHEDESIGTAARRMVDERVGSLAVFSADRLVGILTEADIVRAVADGVDPEQVKVADRMTSHPLTVGIDEDSSVVAEKMLGFGIRHVPVTDSGTVVGIVSIRDLAILEAWQPAPADAG